MVKQDIIQRKGGPIRKEIRESIIDNLTSIIENGNILGANHKQLADKYSKEHKIIISRLTIAKLIKEVYSSIPEEDIHHTRVKIEVMFNKIFRIVQDMIKNAITPKDKKEAIDLLLRAMDRFTAFLESFGIKAKAIENIHLQGEIDNKIELVIIDKKSLPDNSKAIDV